MLGTGSQVLRAEAEAAALAQGPLHLVDALGFGLAALGPQPDPHLRAVLLALHRTHLQQTGWEEEREKGAYRHEMMLSFPASIQMYPPKILGISELTCCYPLPSRASVGHRADPAGESF